MLKNLDTNRKRLSALKLKRYNKKQLFKLLRQKSLSKN